MRSWIVLLFVVLLTGWPTRACAQRTLIPCIAGSGGVVYADNEVGLDLTLSLGGTYRNVFGFLHVADLGFIPKPGSDRYYMDTFSNDQQRCRDRETGRFAKTSLCGGTVKVTYAAAVDINVIIPSRHRRIFFGIGTRTGAATTHYGSFGAIFHRRDHGRYFVKASVGQQFFQIGIGGSLDVSIRPQDS